MIRETKSADHPFLALLHCHHMLLRSEVPPIVAVKTKASRPVGMAVAFVTNGVPYIGWSKCKTKEDDWDPQTGLGVAVERAVPLDDALKVNEAQLLLDNVFGEGTFRTEDTRVAHSMRQFVSDVAEMAYEYYQGV